MQGKISLDHELVLSLKMILLFQLLVDITIFLDITLARQIFCLIYLAFIPGILLMKVLRIVNLKPVKALVFAMALSLALVMFIGALANEIYPIFGFSEPLSTVSLTVSMNVFVIFLCLIIHLRRSSKILSESFNFSPFIIPFGFLPVLSIFGTYQVYHSGNNSLLLLMIAAIPLLVALGAFSKKLLPPTLYPQAIFCIAIALLFHITLVTDYIVGWDIHTEYYVFSFTKSNLRWDRSFAAIGRYRTELLSANSMLSITVLPTVYSQILGISGSSVFKVLYPLAFAFVPLALYELWSSELEKRISLVGIFFSMFFIVSLQGFYSFIPPKQMIAELFFVILFLLLLDDKIVSWKKSFLFAIFSAALIVSHYSTSYLFMFFIIAIWLLGFFASRLSSSFFGVGKRINLSQIVLFFVMAVSWYLYTSSSGVLAGLSGYVDNISRNLVEDLFNPGARGSAVLTGIGLTASPSFLHQIGRIFFYITEGLIVIGFLKIIFKREKHAKPRTDYLVLMSLNALILLMTIIIPNFAGLLRMGRFYHYALLFLAPMCVMGGKAVFSFFLKSKNEFMALFLTFILIITPFFLFESEFIYAISGDNSASISIGLNMWHMDPFRLYQEISVEQEVVSARWLSTYAATAESITVGDYISTYHVLTSYGMIPRDRVRVLSNFTFEGYFNLIFETIDDRTYIYMRRLNVIHGEISGGYNITQYESILNNQNKIYSNGDSEIYNGLVPPQP
ncbi:MAG: DUF2206 domain-containing protein [Candidatus Bathyarchaeota archaeon]|nr:MAG: DUF2206 domain-containing protein [Candidatus Bathyarchaeota archaeon]